MPSPVGHAVAGFIIGLAGERAASKEVGSTHQRTSAPAHPRTSPWAFLFACAFLAAAPDLDWIYPPIHRGPTHSFAAGFVVMLLAAAATRRLTGAAQWKTAVILGLAYTSHIVMDWLGEDLTLTPGVKALWPITDRLFMSGWDIFLSTMRFEPFASPQLEHNLNTLAREMLLLLPILAWLLWRRRKRIPG